MATINPTNCNCLAVRQAARYVTQLYDQYLTAVGLRATQHAILAKLKRHRLMAINALAAELVMDRTTLGRNVRLLERDGLIVIETDREDRRSKVLRLSKAGEARFHRAHKAWAAAQKRFERTYGDKQAAELRRRLWDVVTSGLVTFDPTVVE